MSSPDPRVLRQLRHDVDDVHQLLDTTNGTISSIAAVQHHHGERLDEIQQALDLQHGRLERIEDTQRQILDLLQRRD